ncbi:hypothetical protein WJX81_005269 [Elliptochloris bilobata]|uniref:BZIP domain-containing protein n=1 Tax=Elliptochloris bilobata TaxID=381761 RepID=A0AAW1QUQ3_9CHLO
MAEKDWVAALMASSPSDDWEMFEGDDLLLLPGKLDAGPKLANESSEEKKRQARMARNRESALHSRQRKKMHADELERRCDALAADNRRLAGLALPPGFAPVAWMPGLPLGVAPKVPIQKIRPVRPAPAARPAPATPAAAPAAKAPPRKRARVAAGGTALLALCCFAVFSGPLWPMGGGSNGAAPFSAGTGMQLAVLPEGVRAGGRVLQALDPMEGNWSEEAVAAGGGAAAALSLAKARSWDHAAEGAGLDDRQGHLALQQLKDLAPVTLYSDAGAAGGLASAWSLMPASLGGDAGGLLPPMQCKEVFTLKAGPDVDPAAARRQLQKYIGTFRGRALLGPLPLPPPPAKGSDNAAQEPRILGGPRSKIGCDKDEPEVIVSIMLGEGDEHGVKQIYVVVVEPRHKFSTYACSLPDHVSLA